MLEKLSSCPICNSINFKEHISCRDFLISNEEFKIMKCEECDFLFTNPRPDKHNIGSYYKSDQYISHTDKSNNLVNSLYRIVRQYTIKQKVKLISSYCKQKTVLDFGCGTGDLLLALKKENWKVYGFEPDDDANKIARKKTEIEIFKQMDQLDQKSNISVITLWHVLEHVTDLNKTIDKLKTLLIEEGKMIIAVPNNLSYDAQKYKTYWAAYDLPRHLYHFSQNSINNLLQNHGLKIIDILPMKFDSFYVSLLSEKYKTGRSNLIKSFVNGCISNVYAKINNKNYSSLIYIVSK